MWLCIERVDSSVRPGLPPAAYIHVTKCFFNIADMRIGSGFRRFWITIDDGIHQMIMLITQMFEILGSFIKVFKVVVNTSA